MIDSILVLAAATTTSWGPSIAIVMVICNVLAIAIGKFTIQQQTVGASTPIAGMSAGAVVGSICLGHILGAGVILGLANVGVL
ncbi:photosystem I reaction center subunit PsaK [Lyngbya sp. CCY1209]|uniref:photosystem I reaction center subunit PsaK n=1 Tax=Lyngbya sp. CCY1209 TaxID=2886103 RepID=UPI002D2052B4|nr:photosystem I reaction center subunit PsaK [Lyngbya sp. CCY1209]MEB3883120.1 photosystem I reaction center subunit PsaK [Lyngbya sp. CCY1209]